MTKLNIVQINYYGNIVPAGYSVYLNPDCIISIEVREKQETALVKCTDGEKYRISKSDVEGLLDVRTTTRKHNK